MSAPTLKPHKYDRDGFCRVCGADNQEPDEAERACTVTEPTLKPGTRCECSLSEGAIYTRQHADAHRNAETRAVVHACPRDAVRMVTVRGALVVNGTLEVPNQERTLAFCEPCAAFHESKGTR